MSDDFILDEDFEGFLEDFGEPNTNELCSKEVMGEYTGKLSNRLIEYWKEYGFCSFKNGLFWIVNPSDYKDILDDWFDKSSVPIDDVYHVFARNAFGDLFIWGEKTGYRYEIVAANGWVIKKKGSDKKRHNFATELFFGGLRVKDQDVSDLNGNYLFEKCIKKFGHLEKDEIFGFEPSLILGGEPMLENINKVDIYVHLSILAQLGEIEVLDHDALIRKAF